MLCLCAPSGTGRLIEVDDITKLKAVQRACGKVCGQIEDAERRARHGHEADTRTRRQRSRILRERVACGMQRSTATTHVDDT